MFCTISNDLHYSSPANAMATVTASQPTLSLDPKADYIIVFDTKHSAPTPPAAEGESEKQSNKAEQQEKLQDEYSNLLSLLGEAGLEATGRSGGKNSGQIFVFVRATETRLQAEIHRER